VVETDPKPNLLTITTGPPPYTNYEVDPWWAVDLGATLAVVGVLFTNRAENFGNYLVYPVYHCLSIVRVNSKKIHFRHSFTYTVTECIP